MQNLSDLLAALTSNLSDAFLGTMGAEYPAETKQYIDMLIYRAPLSGLCLGMLKSVNAKPGRICLASVQIDLQFHERTQQAA